MTPSLRPLAAALCCLLATTPTHAAWKLVIDDSMRPAPKPAAAPVAPVAPAKLVISCSHRVRAGDTLQKIARSRLGTAARWREIVKLNNLENPDMISVGDTLRLPCDEKPIVKADPPPSRPRGDKDVSHAVQQALASATPAKPAAAPERRPDPETRTAHAPPPGGCAHRVRSGDTLGKIAAAQLGDADRWREIAKLNNLENPDLIRVGQPLRLPCDEERPIVVASLPPAAPPADATAALPPGAAEIVPPTPAPPPPLWEASSGDLLDDVVARWAIEAGYEVIIQDRWNWQLDVPFSHRGTFRSAVTELLSGFPQSGRAPAVTFYRNDVVVVEFR